MRGMVQRFLACQATSESPQSSTGPEGADDPRFTIVSTTFKPREIFLQQFCFAFKPPYLMGSRVHQS